MFTALVTFLVAVTMILGGAGSPVQVILDSLPIDIASTFEGKPEVSDEPAQVRVEAQQGSTVRTGKDDAFDPPPDPVPNPEPNPEKPDPASDAEPKAIQDPEPATVIVRNKEQLGNGPYYGEKAPESDPVEAPEEAALVDEPPPVEEELPGNRPDEAGAGKPDEIIPDPLPDPDPQPDPNPAPDPAPKDCEVDECPAPDPQPGPMPDPVPVQGDSPGGPNDPAPAPNCEGDDCPVPDPIPEPGQPATGGGEGDGNETGGSEDGGNAKP